MSKLINKKPWGLQTLLFIGKTNLKHVFTLAFCVVLLVCCFLSETNASELPSNKKRSGSDTPNKVTNAVPYMTANPFIVTGACSDHCGSLDGTYTWVLYTWLQTSSPGTHDIRWWPNHNPPKWIFGGRGAGCYVAVYVNYTPPIPGSNPHAIPMTGWELAPNSPCSDPNFTMIDPSAPTNQDPDCSGAAIADQSADGNCQATISAADVTGVTDPDNDALTITVSPTVLGLGANTVTVSADDGNGGECSTEITVNVEDETDPEISVSNDQLGMWPPNHKYKTFTVADFGVSVTDNCGCCVEATITNVTSDEPDDVKGGGDGNTKNDIVIASDGKSVKLRAERQGGGDGRVYTITLTAEDGSGNTTDATCEVIVPHDKKGLPKGIGGFISDSEMALPEDYFLSQNYPNPFNPETTISFGLPKAEAVTLNIYNSAGQLIRTLTSGSYSAGLHNVTWDATDYNGVRVANGIYIYELKTNNYLQQRKMLLIK